MPIPDISKLVDNVKSVLRPGLVVPEDAAADPIGYRISELTTLIKKVYAVNEQQSQDLGKINNLLEGLFQDLKSHGIDTSKAESQAEATAIPAEKSEASSTTPPEEGEHKE